MNLILDASAVLAWLFREPAGPRVRAAIDTAAMAAPNWSEVLQKARRQGLDAEEVGATILGFGLSIIPVDREDAAGAALLWQAAAPLSLADRFCLAVGERLDLPVWTCDRSWAAVSDRVVVLR